MNRDIRPPADATDLSLAVGLAISMHIGLAYLPVAWRPISSTPTVLRVTLAASPAVAVPPPAPVTSAAPVAPLSEATAPANIAPPPTPAALANPAPVVKALQPQPKPRIKSQPPKPKPIKPVVEPSPAAARPPQATPPRLAKSKPTKPAERSPVVVKTTGDGPSQRFERGRPTRMEQAASAHFASPTGISAKTASGGKKATDSNANSSATVTASTQPVRVATVATGLRPLPGNPPPRYPPLARQRGIEGRVLLRLTINAVGGVETVSIAQSSGNALLDQEARLTVARWRFQPPQGPMQAVAQVPISFRLQN
ncbi:MAG: TonB family protein [Candidatus Competibacteraceae bacterium]|nr:TonB family protein [Candidatus Competibacteraceae bacterium]